MAGKSKPMCQIKQLILLNRQGKGVKTIAGILEINPIAENSKKIDFSHAIQFWGSKANRLERKDFTNIQENRYRLHFLLKQI